MGIGTCRVALDGVTQQIETGGCHHPGGQRVDACRIHQRLVGENIAARQNELGVVLHEPDHRQAGHLGARAGGRRTGNMRLNGSGNRDAVTDRRSEVGGKARRVTRVDHGRLGGIHDRAAAERHQPVEIPFLEETGRIHDRGVRRLDTNLVEHRVVDARRLEGFSRALHVL